MSVINQVVNEPPRPGNWLSVARLGSTETFDLREVYQRSDRVAAHLLGLGVRPGDRIGVLAANGLEWVLLDLAALRIKAATAGFDPAKFDESGTDLLTRYDLTLLFTDREPDTEGVRQVGELRDLPESTVQLPAVTYAPEEATTLKFTSGSTGRAKSLTASVGSIDSSLRAVQEMFGHGPGDNLFVFLPLSLLQQRYWVYSALVFEHDVTITTYQAAFATMSASRPTVVMGVPAFFDAACAHIEAKIARGADPTAAVRALFGDRIRYLWTGSAPANPATLRYFAERGPPIYEGYGLNETCIIAKNHPGAYREGSVGRVVPGKEVTIDDDGVICVRSARPVATGYEHAAPGDSEKRFRPGGVVRTGDLGYLDEDGFLFIRGRADDVIVLENGKKIVVRPIEEHLMQSPEIEECVVLRPSQTQLVAVVSPAHESANEELIAAQLKATNAAYGRDEQVAKVVVAERFTVANGLLTSQFKPRRTQILDRYRNQIISSQEGIHA